MANNKLGSPVNEPETLPCGCKHWTSRSEFFYVPCSMTCEFYLFAIRRSREIGTPVVYRRNDQ